MSEDEKTPTPTRRYVVTDSEGQERLIKATSPSAAIQQVYETKVRVASGDDIERLLTSR